MRILKNRSWSGVKPSTFDFTCQHSTTIIRSFPPEEEVFLIDTKKCFDSTLVC